MKGASHNSVAKALFNSYERMKSSHLAYRSLYSVWMGHAKCMELEPQYAENW
jgi:hypothetical protein